MDIPKPDRPNFAKHICNLIIFCFVPLKIDFELLIQKLHNLAQVIINYKNKNNSNLEQQIYQN